jgi:putative ABC transport system substrate-binding protein
VDRTRRRILVLPLGLAGLHVAAQTPRTTRTLGVLHWEDRPAYDRLNPDFFPALARHGWREGATLTLDWRQARMDSPTLDRTAAELAAARPDAILTESTWGTAAAARATRSIPIVTRVGDPVRTGFAASLARPGGNITGLSIFTEGFEAKCIEILRTLVPTVQQVAVFSWGEADPHYTRPLLSAIAQAGLAARSVVVTSEASIAQAVAEAARKGAGGAFIGGGFKEESTVGPLGSAATAARLPLLVLNTDFPQHALLAFQPYHARPALRLAALVDKVFRGGHPSEIAFEQSDRVKLVVNRRIAKAMGREIPGEILLRATDVIDS